MSSPAKEYDVLWIGTGQATLTVVPRLAAAGKKVAIAEGGAFGGTCVNFGCTPTKTLVASAYAVHLARRGKDFGFAVDGLQVDFAAVMATQQTNRSKSSAWIRDALAKHGDVYAGMATFVDPHTLEVNGTQIRGKTIVLHAGTRPAIPQVAGLETVPFLTNQSLLDLQELPPHLVVMGGSFIALEFAQIFRRLGSQVTVVQRGPRLLSREDEDIGREVQKALELEEIRVVCNAALERVSPDGGVTLHVSVAGQPERITGSHLLVAVGRTLNSDRLNAGAAGLEISPRGAILVNDVMQTNQPHIYAVGDINGRGAFTHTSVNDGEIFWDHYARAHGLSSDPPELDRTAAGRQMISAMFIDPPLARVGMNEREARESGRKILMATAPMTRIARAREKRETLGLVKILVDADSEQIVGATILGTSGDEVIGSFAAFMQTGKSWKHFRRVVFPHPTVSELMPWFMDNLAPLQ